MRTHREILLELLELVGDIERQTDQNNEILIRSEDAIEESRRQLETVRKMLREQKAKLKN